MAIIIQIQITYEKKRIIDPGMFRNGYSAGNTMMWFLLAFES